MRMMRYNPGKIIIHGYKLHYVNLNNECRKISFLDIFLTTNNKSYVKGDQAYTCNLHP